METYEIVSLVALVLTSGVAGSLIVQFIKSAGMSSRVKYGLALGISGVMGIATVWLAGDIFGLISGFGELTAADVFAVMGAVYASAVGFYELYFKGAVEAHKA